jgi:hypothetical protein
MKHALWRDTARDESVRAALEHLRSLAHDHYQEFEDLVAIVGRINARLERLEEASSTVDHENKGVRMTKSDRQAAEYRAEAIASPFANTAERSSTVSKTGEGQSGRRTERVTLQFEVERGSPPSEWPWSYILSRSDALKMRPGESVRVVEEAAQAASGGGEGEMSRAGQIESFDGTNLPKCTERDNLAQVGGGEGEPAQWAVLYPTGRLGSSFDTKDQADSLARNQSLYQLTVVPLYRAPPPPRGWLTDEEREALGNLVAAICPSGSSIYRDEIRTVESFLARTARAEVGRE